MPIPNDASKAIFISDTPKGSGSLWVGKGDKGFVTKHSYQEANEYVFYPKDWKGYCTTVKETDFKILTDKKMAKATNNIQWIATNSIIPDPNQPRKHFDEAENIELALSVRDNGVIQPILVRPITSATKGISYMVVYGHRRLWATKYNKMETIPAQVRDITDEQAYDYQVIENLQRKDISPLDEAIAFKKILKGASLEMLASKIHKSKQYILDRIKLNDLSSIASNFLKDDLLPLSHAIVISRLTHEQQDELLSTIISKEIVNKNNESDDVETEDDEQSNEYTIYKLYCNITLSDLKRKITNLYMLYLSKAPFALDDENLLSNVSACSICPKRTINSQLLFSDITSDDKCTDAVCFKQKTDQHIANVIQLQKSKNDNTKVGEMSPYSHHVIVNGKSVTYKEENFEGATPIVIKNTSKYNTEVLGKVVYALIDIPKNDGTENKKIDKKNYWQEERKNEFNKIYLPRIQSIASYINNSDGGVTLQRNLVQVRKSFLIERLFSADLTFLISYRCAIDINYEFDLETLHEFVTGLDHESKKECVNNIISDYYNKLAIYELLDCYILSRFYDEDEENADFELKPDSDLSEFSYSKYLRLLEHPLAKEQPEIKEEATKTQEQEVEEEEE